MLFICANELYGSVSPVILVLHPFFKPEKQSVCFDPAGYFLNHYCVQHTMIHSLFILYPMYPNIGSSLNIVLIESGKLLIKIFRILYHYTAHASRILRLRIRYPK